ncbi:cytochrome P450 [Hypoxylon cercidicola]|nr:cytochrome P450 [Hypoxylon cercidicola]
MEVDSLMAAIGFPLQGMALWTFLWVWPKLNIHYQDTVLALAAFISFRYAWVVTRYRIARRRFHNSDQVVEQVPPTYPSLIPFLGNAITMALDTTLFTRVATFYKGESTSTRVSMLGSAVYFFQDRSTVLQLLRMRSSLTPLTVRFIFPAKTLFGMPEVCGLDAYRIDNSGPFKKPHPGSNVLQQDRIDHLHHHEFRNAFLGPGLGPTTARFRRSIKVRMGRSIASACEWVELDDLFVFASRVVSAAVIEAIFGSYLLRLHPDFVTNLWAYDNGTPWLLRMVPRWLNPQPYRAQKRVLEQIQEWYIHARQDSGEYDILGDEHGDPFWGSAIVKRLQNALVDSGKQSDEAMSAHDLGWIWGATTSPASAAALAIFHIYSDPELLVRVRAELKEQLPHLSSFDKLDSKQLRSLPLLSSIYAETMRLYSNVFLMVASPPDTDVSLGKWKFPRRSFGLISSSLAHTDDNFWNTKDDSHPIDTFWADRFLVYPGDPTSGPIKPEIRAAMTSERLQQQRVEEGSKGSPYFSTKNLEGSYMPFGGGSGKCPGRFLAKDVIMLTCALLVSEYDVKISDEPLEYKLDMDPWKFGLGMGQPRFPIAARIRRRFSTTRGHPI